MTIRAALADGGPGTGIYCKATKRNDWRDVPLTEQMVEVFRSFLRSGEPPDAARSSSSPDSFVFSEDVDGARGFDRTRRVSAGWRRGTNKVTFAMLRRYVATQLLDATNGDYRTVASITGNSEETLRRWYDAGPNLEKKAAVMTMARL